MLLVNHISSSILVALHYYRLSDGNITTSVSQTTSCRPTGINQGRSLRPWKHLTKFHCAVLKLAVTHEAPKRCYVSASVTVVALVFLMAKLSLIFWKSPSLMLLLEVVTQFQWSARLIFFCDVNPSEDFHTKRLCFSPPLKCEFDNSSKVIIITFLDFSKYVLQFSALSSINRNQSFKIFTECICVIIILTIRCMMKLFERSLAYYHS